MRRRLVGSLALALSLTGLGPLTAAPASAAPGTPGRPGLEVAETRAPDHVTLHRKARSADPQRAAREVLAAEAGRLHIDAEGGLRQAGTVEGDHTLAQRFVQEHEGVEVYGSGYVVRFRDQDGVLTATSAGGDYFTGLTVSTTPRVDRAAATRSVRARLHLAGVGDAEVEARGLSVLPVGEGILAQVVQARFVDERTMTPQVLDVMVDAGTGALLASVQRTRSLGEVESEETRLTGDRVTLDATAQEGGYLLVDTTRGAGPITTIDAAGRDVRQFAGALPAGAHPYDAPALPFGAAATAVGAVDAHFGMASVHDYYSDGFGWEGLDGQGGPMVSVVGVTNNGKPYANAFWDGEKMVFGGGAQGYHPFSAALDVVAHEMTHGVVAHSAGLVYLGQSGALDEAVADYFGNAVQLKAEGTPMTDPAAGLVGEDLCVRADAVSCALRDLNEPVTVEDDFQGIVRDSAGVHVNSTIPGSAMWDVREALGAERADALAFTVLTQHLTPLADFEDLRTAYLTAAREAGYAASEVEAVRAAFDRVGIVEGWEEQLSLDSRLLMTGIDHLLADGILSSDPVAAQGNWAIADADPALAGRVGIWAGDVRGAEPARRISPDDGWWHDTPETDGRAVVWLSGSGSGQTRLWRGDIRHQKAQVVLETSDYVGQVVVSGARTAWSVLDWETFSLSIRTRTGNGPVRDVPTTPGAFITSLTADGNQLGWVEETYDEEGYVVNTAWSYDLASGRKVMVAQPASQVGHGRLGQLVLEDGLAFWAEDTDYDGVMAIKTRDRLGAGRERTVVDEHAAGAPLYPSIDGTGTAVTYVDLRGSGQYTNAAAAKLMQVPTTGGAAYRVSCNRGEQSWFAADEDRGVVWLDATLGTPRLVHREAVPGTTC